ncbi:hypothetical protein PG996_007313 [Apiospora saccharicola]|uniref:Uncharacterized protein n=1 Tax=Apiospora saccharicola TaxID=335842 RepID=A0ABR1VAI9_9PEZI
MQEPVLLPASPMHLGESEHLPVGRLAGPGKPTNGRSNRAADLHRLLLAPAAADAETGRVPSRTSLGMGVGRREPPRRQEDGTPRLRTKNPNYYGTASGVSDSFQWQKLGAMGHAGRSGLLDLWTGRTDMSWAPVSGTRDRHFAIYVPTKV